MRIFLTILFCVIAASVSAQSSVGLGNLNVAADTPIEAAADNLSVDQNAGTAVFTGNAIISQGDIRLSAQKIVITYSNDGGISRIDAQMQVLFTSPSEEVEAEKVVYTLSNEKMIFEDNVIFVQGPNVISADRMTIDLAKNAAVMEGRVRSILQSGGNQ
ncbi:MAG: LptA/OstA family protein [Planktomarina sp.]